MTLAEPFALGILNVKLQYQAKCNLFSLCFNSCETSGILTVLNSE